jgi:hypothetical protein
MRWPGRVFTPYRVATALIVINVVGGASALSAASVTPTPVGLTLPTHAKYILGLFLVNLVMHLLIGSLELFVTGGTSAPKAYLTGHFLPSSASLQYRTSYLHSWQGAGRNRQAGIGCRRVGAGISA